jgi:hypothetical protein
MEIKGADFSAKEGQEAAGYSLLLGLSLPRI